MVDIVLNLHPELYQIVSADIQALGKNNEMGRQDGPAEEQVVRVALYKELKGLNYQINVSKKAEERDQLFAQQLNTLRRCIEQTAKALKKLHGDGKKANRKTRKLCQRLEELLPKMMKVYSMASRKELFGQHVPKEEKLFSIFEDHTDIIIKGAREVQFGHKVDLAVGRNGMILVCQVAEGNPSDHSFYPEMLQRLKKNYGVTLQDLAIDGGYASLDNLQMTQKHGVANIVFNKIVGSLKNLVSSASVEKRLKKWRSGIEAVISNWKRGFQMFRCEWKGRVRFEVKVLWSMLAYNFRVMTRVALRQITA